jgi:predicted metal-dependent hydrolase
MGSRALEVDGHTVVVSVRRSRRARTLRLVVGRGRPPEVVVPLGVRDRTVDEFLRTHHRWLAGKLADLREREQRPKVLPSGPGVVCLGGEPVPLERRPDRRPHAVLEDGRLMVGGQSDAAAGAVERWYRREARDRLTEAVAHQAPALGVSVTAISVRDQRTRWGSCTRAGRLSFSWRLVLAPPGVLTYVVAHELCHLREFNHSRAFWRLVESVRPDWRDAAAWLREHGPEVHAYRPDLDG